MSCKKRKPTFVLVVPRFEDIFHSYYAGEIIKGASLSASRLNADILIHITDRSNHRTWLDSSLTDGNFVDGILFADIDNDLSVVKKAISNQIPCMILNNIIEQPFNYVAIDNKDAGYAATKHLIDHGHKKIATIAGDSSTQSGIMRLGGFMRAMNEAGLDVPKAYVQYGDFLRTKARSAAEKLLKLKQPPTAVFVASDVMALEFIDVAQKAGQHVPKDLSVIGFDNNPFWTHSGNVGLDTISQPLIEMGRVGLENLHLISKGKMQLPSKVILSTHLIKRKTVKRI